MAHKNVSVLSEKPVSQEEGLMVPGLHQLAKLGVLMTSLCVWNVSKRRTQAVWEWLLGHACD